MIPFKYLGLDLSLFGFFLKMKEEEKECTLFLNIS